MDTMLHVLHYAILPSGIKPQQRIGAFEKLIFSLFFIFLQKKLALSRFILYTAPAVHPMGWLRQKGKER